VCHLLGSPGLRRQNKKQRRAQKPGICPRLFAFHCRVVFSPGKGKERKRSCEAQNLAVHFIKCLRLFALVFFFLKMDYLFSLS
jgi:hypothetical protein